MTSQVKQEQGRRHIHRKVFVYIWAGVIMSAHCLEVKRAIAQVHLAGLHISFAIMDSQ